jgi:hypothetical protein
MFLRKKRSMGIVFLIRWRGGIRQRGRERRGRVGRGGRGVVVGRTEKMGRA